ncbi:hypothetical protein [Mesorhizobium sp. RMAD-H1]|uniref:hypothetical protein n=1 Tax=Mesorhizobium sp. RMAD-H1 TaxID=2587065 RepID=UPI00161507CC|nr:hypothetical protein [Mesorhizobium sp. RMAD-H1]MBB2974105.1 hypothetical protein [Mesorhizobium sp. RMAD-H1]
MTREQNLERLLKLRRMRMTLSENALLLQNRARRQAESGVHAALQDIAQHDSMWRAEEQAAIDQMALQPLSSQALAQEREKMDALARQADELKQAEQTAEHILATEMQRQQEKLGEHRRKLREHDKVLLMAQKDLEQRHRQAAMQSELEEEEQMALRSASDSGRRVRK